MPLRACSHSLIRRSGYCAAGLLVQKSSPTLEAPDVDDGRVDTALSVESPIQCSGSRSASPRWCMWSQAATRADRLCATAENEGRGRRRAPRRRAACSPRVREEIRGELGEAGESEREYPVGKLSGASSLSAGPRHDREPSRAGGAASAVESAEKMRSDHRGGRVPRRGIDQLEMQRHRVEIDVGSRRRACARSRKMTTPDGASTPTLKPAIRAAPRHFATLSMGRPYLHRRSRASVADVSDRVQPGAATRGPSERSRRCTGSRSAPPCDSQGAGAAPPLGPSSQRAVRSLYLARKPSSRRSSERRLTTREPSSFS